VLLTWTRLLKHVFDLELEHCPNCGGELKIIAISLEQPVIENAYFSDRGRLFQSDRGR